MAESEVRCGRRTIAILPAATWYIAVGLDPPYYRVRIEEPCKFPQGQSMIVLQLLEREVAIPAKSVQSSRCWAWPWECSCAIQ